MCECNLDFHFMLHGLPLEYLCELVKASLTCGSVEVIGEH